MTKSMRVFGLAAMLAASGSPAVAQADLEEWHCYYTVSTGLGTGYNDEGFLRIVDNDLRAYWVNFPYKDPAKPELGREKQEGITNYTIVSNDKNALIALRPANKPRTREESGIGTYVMVLDKSDGRWRLSKVVVEQNSDLYLGRCEKK
jgi:hypothetical protein